MPSQLRNPGRSVWIGGTLALIGVVCVGCAVAVYPLLAPALCALAVIVIATRWVNVLAVVMFWTLPYMVISLPTGAFTLKLCDVGAYIFAAAWAARALLRRESVIFPPATAGVLIYLAALAVSAALSAPVPKPYLGDVDPNSRNSPDVRSLSLIVWLALSWLAVVAIYNVIGRSPDLLRRCLCAHILSSGLACLISVGMYLMALFFGLEFHEASMGRSLIFNMGNFLRLAGVAYEPLFLGFYLVTVIPVTIVILVCRPDWIPRRLIRFILMLQCAAMLLTFSAGGWAALILALILLAPLLWRRLSVGARRRFLVGMTTAALLTTVATFALPKLQAIISNPLQKVTSGGDSVRKEEWAVAESIFADHPLLGVGPGMARFYAGRYNFQRSQSLGVDLEPSNLYLSILAETGLIGMAAFLCCAVEGVWSLWAVLWRFGPARLSILASLFLSLVGCAAQYISLNPLFLVYFPALIGLATASARLAPHFLDEPVVRKEAS